MVLLQALFLLSSLLPPQCLLLLLEASELYPLVLVPGQSGNQLEARLTDAYQPSKPICGAQKGQGWFRLWLNHTFLLEPPTLPCFAEQMSLFFDPHLDDFRNAPGVQTQVPFFGSTRGFMYIDPDDPKDPVPYMALLVNYLEQIGYNDGDNLFGAPYDFRYGLAADGHSSKVGSQYLQHLKELVEKASKLNGNKPVIILTHSLGGLFALQLLNRNPSSWRRQFIKHFIALSAPWGGTVMEMLMFISGSTLGFPFVEPLVLRDEIRSLESDLWLLPTPEVFGETPLVIARGEKYSASNMTEFLKAIGFSEGVKPYVSRILPLVKELAAPGVPVTVMTGVGIHTPETVVYREGFDELPEIVYGDGDGLVNLVSLLALETEWSNVAQQELKVIRISNISHIDILTDDSALREIVRELYDVNSLALSSIA